VTDIEPFVVETLLTREDVTAFQRAWAERARARVGRLRHLGALVLPLLAGAVLVNALHLRPRDGALLAFLVGTCAMAGGLLWTTRLFRQWTLPEEGGFVLGPVRMEFSPEGLRGFRHRSTALTRWSAVQEVTQTDRHVFLWLDRHLAFIVPLRDLPEGLDARAAVERIRAFVAGAGEPFSGGLPSGAGSEDRPGRGIAARAAELARWLRLDAPSEPGTGPGDGAIALRALAALAVWLAFDRYAAGAEAQWYFAGVSGLAWYAAGVLALAFVLHRASGRAASLRALLASLLAVLPLALALGLALRQWAPVRTRELGYALLAVATLAYAARRLHSLTGHRQPRALIAGALFVLMFVWATGAAWVYPHLWYADTDDEEGASAWAEGERLLFEQADRIDQAAARLTPGRPGPPDVFFLGFAGVAEQKVFSEEARLSERVVEDRYGAAGRSLLLVNDRRDHDTWPLATVSGLRRALLRIGERMDPSEDVLFLLLTSHGSAEPSLSVSNGRWPLEQLDGKTLRAALDASRIKWRVIVISACHSGAFIEPLANDDTIVLTSAAFDRTSFGCGDQDELTYFGTAFLRDALPEAPSLSVAFQRARDAIAERERRERMTPSLPQSYFGHAMAEHWRHVEAARHPSAR
jgi:hypothetical protein